MLPQKLNAITLRLKKIFLVEDLVDSLKFAAGSFRTTDTKKKLLITTDIE